MHEIPYKKAERQPYNVLASVFNSVMQRELEIVNEYWTGAPLRVFHRSNKNTNEQGSKSQCYYYADEGISEGTLLDIYGKIYLSLNQSTVENPLYKKSDLFECNIIIDTFSNSYELIIPGFFYYLTSVYGNDFPQVGSIGGNVEVITEDCEASRKISVNSRFNALDSEWMVVDRIIRNGLMHFYIEKQVNSAPPERELEILPKAEYEVDTSSYIGVWAKRRDANSNTWATVENATILWESSDNDVVSFDAEGLAHFNNSGTATVTATWKEHGISNTIDIVVAEELLPLYTITYAGQATVKQGGSSKTFTANFGFVEDLGVDIIPVWTLDLSPAQAGKITYTVDDTAKKIVIKASSTAPIGTTFDLWVTTDSYNVQVSAKVTVSIEPLY